MFSSDKLLEPAIHHFLKVLLHHILGDHFLLVVLDEDVDELGVGGISGVQQSTRAVNVAACDHLVERIFLIFSLYDVITI